MPITWGQVAFPRRFYHHISASLSLAPPGLRAVISLVFSPQVPIKSAALVTGPQEMFARSLGQQHSYSLLFQMIK